MTSLKKALARLERFDLDKEAEKVMNDSTEKLIQLNIEQQRSGIGADGQSLPRYRSIKYAQAKHARNPGAPFGVWDMWLTGRFQGAFKSFAKNGMYMIFSTDSKYDSLTQRARHAFGHTPDNKELIKKEIMLPGLRRAFKTNILKK